MVVVEAVLPPVGEADEVLRTVARFAEPVTFEVGFGGEVGEAVAALGGWVEKFVGVVTDAVLGLGLGLVVVVVVVVRFYLFVVAVGVFG